MNNEALKEFERRVPVNRITLLRYEVHRRHLLTLESKEQNIHLKFSDMIRKWIKKLLAPIVREIINEEKLQEQVIGHIATALKEALDSGECDNLKRPNV